MLFAKQIFQQSRRQMGNVIHGPPSIRLPIHEKVAVGLVLTVACLGIPAWVLFHLKDYRTKK